MQENAVLLQAPDTMYSNPKFRNYSKNIVKIMWILHLNLQHFCLFSIRILLESHILYPGYRILWLSPCANPKFSQEGHCITVGLLPCVKVSPYDYFWPGPEVVTISDNQAALICYKLWITSLAPLWFCNHNLSNSNPPVTVIGPQDKRQLQKRISVA